MAKSSHVICTRKVDRTSQTRDFTAALKLEFRSLPSHRRMSLPPGTDTLVVLSAQAESLHDGSVRLSSEDVARIQSTIALAKRIASKRSGIPMRDVQKTELAAHSPTVILNGETEQLPLMAEIVMQCAFPTQRIVLLDCGKR